MAAGRRISQNEETAKAFKSFFNPHVAALHQTLAAFGLGEDAGPEGEQGFAFELHMAPLDDDDVERGYASADVTIVARNTRGEEAAEIRIVLWFVRFGHATPWLLITRNGYLDWLLLGEGDPTQGIPPGLHVAIKQVFPGTLEHYDWYESRGRAVN